MKKGLVATWIVIAMAVVLLVCNFGLNERAIEKYQSGKATEHTFFKQVLIQPYVYYYNKGNVQYDKGDYEMAMKSYEKALRKNPTKKQECKVRINLVLAKLAMVSMEDLDEQKKQELIAYLQDCIDILTEKGCASKKSWGGHDDKAQTLKEEIEHMIESLSGTSQQPQEETPDSQDNDDPQPQQGKSNPQKEQKLEEKYQEMQKQSITERNQQLNDSRGKADSDPFDFEGYDGNCW